MPLFDQAARDKIEAAIARAEQQSAGELVVTTVPASDAYHALRLLYAFAIGIALAALWHIAQPRLGFSALVWIEIGFALAAWLALGFASLLRSVLPPALAQHAVERRAREQFFERKLFATRERTGVLIFLSLLERRVVILGDDGIHARVQTEGWQAHVDRIVRAIQQGRAADGVCEVIAELGAALEHSVPRAADDENELPNAVREEER